MPPCRVQVVKSGLLEELVAAKSYPVYWAQLQPGIMQAIRGARAELAIKEHRVRSADPMSLGIMRGPLQVQQWMLSMGACCV